MKNRMFFVRFLIFMIFLFKFANICASENVKKSVDDNDDIGDEGKDESLEIPSENETNNITMCARRKNSLMHEIQAGTYDQFPFIAAIMSARNEYLCAGSIVSIDMILTTAQCAEAASYILLNTTYAIKDESSLTLNVIKTENFPTHTGNNKDVAIIYTEKLNNTIASKIKVTNNTKFDGVTELEALGFGLNAQVGQNKELQSVGLETEYSAEVNSAFINCIDTKNTLCFKDKGGPVIIGDELVGIIVKGEDDCTSQISGTYAANKHMVDFLAAMTFKTWLHEKMAKNEEKPEEQLETYPKKPIVRESIHVMTSSGHIDSKPLYVIGVYCVILRFF